MTCPTCGGRGEVLALIHVTRDDRRAGERERVMLPCFTCQGSGQIDARHAALMETGKRLRDYRVHVLKRSGREEAARLGLSALAVNHQEHGRLCAACPFDGGCPECDYTPEEAEAWARGKGRLPKEEGPATG